MPEELMGTGSGDHRPENIRRDGQIDIIRPLVNADLPMTARAGVVRRSISNRLGDFISVKDFGARGDGATDDRLAIVAALEALRDIDSPSRTLYFPPGVYMLNSVRRTVAQQAAEQATNPQAPVADPRQVVVFLDSWSNPSRRGTRIFGHGATIKCGFPLPNPVIALNQLNAATPYSMSQVSTMILLVNGGGDLLIEGLKIDGDNRAGYGLQIQDQYGGTQSGSGIQGRGRITIRSCQFVNMYTRRIPYNTSTDLTLNTAAGSESPIVQSNDSSKHPVGGSVGLNIYTSSSNVLVDGCVIKNIGRDPFGGVWSITGCHGMVIYAAAVGGTETSSASDHSLYYVSVKDGNDANSGTIGSPVQTLSRAAALARADTSGKDIHILIRGGEYKMLGTTTNPVFYLNNADSGRAGKKIVYKAYGNEEVVITGSEKISPSAFRPLSNTADATVWSRIKSDVRPNIMVADLTAFDLGLTLPSVWNGRSNGSENEYVSDLPTIPELFFNDKRMTVARWPNIVTSERNGYTFEDSAYIESVVDRGTSGVWSAVVWGANSSSTPTGAPFVDGIFEYPASYDSVVSRWTSAVASGIWMHGFWRWDWADEVYKVVNINTTTRQITVRSRKSQYALQNYTLCSPSGVSNPSGSFLSNPTKRRWYAFNLPEELDAPGEYFIDITERKLYFYPPQNIHANSSIRLSHRAAGGPTQSGVDTTGDGIQDNITEGGTTGDALQFPYPGWASGTSSSPSVETTQRKHFYNTRDILKSLFKFHKVKDVNVEGLTFRDCAGSGIELNMCENMTINKCKVFNMRRDGIAAMGGKNVTIQKCEVYDIGRNAVINTGGNRQTLTAANKVVTECSIKRWGRIKPTHCSGLVMNGVGNTASKNLFSDGSTAILCGGNDHVIELNHFHNLLADVDDQGAIYAGRDMSSINKTVRRNFFNNVGSRLPGGPYGSGCTSTGTHLTTAVYWDDHESKHTVSENVFYRCGTDGGAVFFNGGVFHTVQDNIFVECHTAYGATRYSQSSWNSFLAGRGDYIFNNQGYPWWENGEGTSPARIVGYSPYNWVASDNGTQFYVDASWAGVMNTVNIRTSTYQSKYPHLATFIEDAGGNTPRLVASQISNMKNTANRNIIVNCTRPINDVSGSTVGGWTVSNEMITSDKGIFVNPNSQNFKLTPAGLAAVRAQVGSSFPDIPFESIPKVDYVPEKYSNLVDYQSQKTVTVRNCHIENVYNLDGWGNYSPLTSAQAAAGGVSSETIGNPGSSVVWIPSGSFWATANADADGMLVFAGDRRITPGLEEYDNCSASIVGNHFVNCKGRDVKAQMEEVVIQANISHNAIKPIGGGGTRMNCQIGCGQVCDNIFHFETAKLKNGQVEGDGNPFNDTPGDRSWANSAIYEQVDLFNDRIGSGSCVISFYAGRRLPRNRGITITGNHVYNNVSGSGGYLGNLFSATEGTGTSTTTLNPAPTFPNEPKPVLCSVSQNKIVGRVDSQSQMFGYLGTRGPNAQSSEVPVTPVYYIINDNMMNNLQSGPATDGVGAFPTSTFLAFVDGSFSRNFVKCDGNVHARIGPQHPRVAARRPNTTTFDFVYDGNLSAVDNRNISSPYYSRSTSRQSFGSRIETLASSDGESDGVRVKGFLRNSDPTGDANYGRILLKGMDEDPLSCIVIMSTRDWWELAGGVFFVSGTAMPDGTCLHPINNAGSTTVGGRLVFSKTIFSGTSRPAAEDGKVVLWLSQEQDADALSAGASASYLVSNPAFYLNFINRLDDASPSTSRRFTFSVFG